jgi:hypothetical protein
MRRSGIEETDHRHCRLLRARRERPRSSRATEQAANSRRPLPDMEGPSLNLKTAKALGITVPLPLSGRADEVFE